MDAERWRRVETLFHRALPLDAAERERLLAAECATDADLRREVEHLLACDAEPHALVDRLDEGALRPVDDPMLEREVGAYRLTARIAVGGMGVVYRAERTDGLFKREAAIKLIRAELATDNLLRRFEVERSTLAALHHPNIAQLHDAGTTADGRPYLVMELVRGTPIDRYCEERALGVDERLRLFVRVCRAVYFAHQNLVVHRDIKPANVLIDEGGEPKLLDFGIARLLDDGGDAGEGGLTQTGAQVFTPDYASPEQLTRGPVTTAMDVYSLGVVLYELLTGRRPFPSGDLNPVEWHRAVLERPPTRPSSTALWSEAREPAEPGAEPRPLEIAARRGCTPRSLRRRLRGDLDRIVMTALRKEPDRRYSSAKDLADDIERHFAGLPILARPDSFTYRATTFVRRNRLAVGAAAAVFVALAFGAVAARQGELAARRGEQRAREEAEHARIETDSFQLVSEFLMDSFLTSASTLDPEQLERHRRRIQMHAARLRREHADEDHLRANLLDSLGRVAARLGLAEDARELVEEARDIRVAAFGTHSLEYALSLRSLGMLRYEAGEAEPAAELFAQALAIHRASPEETHTDVAAVANDLAACQRLLGRLDEAEALHREALALRQRFAPGSLAVAESLNNLAVIELDRNDQAAAAELLEESLAIRRRILGGEEPLTLQAMSNLATVRWRMGEHERAYALLDEVAAGLRALRVDGEEQLAQVLSNRAAMLLAERRLTEAEPLVDEALELLERRLGPDHPLVASALSKQARLFEDLGRPDEAREVWSRVLAIRRAPGGSPRALAQALYDYGAFLRNLGQVAAAKAAFGEAIDALRAVGAAQTPLMGYAQLALGQSFLDAGDAEAARPHLEGAVDALAASSPENDQTLRVARAALLRSRGGEE